MTEQAKVPGWALGGAIDVARVIDTNGGKASNVEVAALLGYSGINNGAFLTRMASAKQFGLVQGRGTDLSTTERAVRILRPDFPATAEKAKIEAFLSIPVYKAFYEAYKDQTLPNREGAINALQSRFHVPAKRAREVYNLLMASAEAAGLFRVSGKNRMIVPTVGAPSPPPDPAKTEGKAEGALPSDEGRTVSDLEQRLGKLLMGVIEVLPASESWDEASLEDWLTLAKTAVRLRYKITPSAPRKEVPVDQDQKKD